MRGYHLNGSSLRVQVNDIAGRNRQREIGLILLEAFEG